jgi:beta-lactamase regulating signal transducer with metallopeptidase domain
MLASLALPALAVVRRAAPLTPASSAAVIEPDERPAGPAGWEALLARAARRAGLAVAAPAAWRRLDRPLALAWAAATLLLLARRAVAARRLARRARAWPARVVGGMRVRVAADAGPAVMGVRRPEVVVPAWALADPRLPLVLRHEEEHRRARDPLLLAAAELAAACAPWNPALWWQLGRLRAAVEIDCDRRVLGDWQSGAPVDRGLYGRLLLDVAGRAVARPALAPALAARRVTALERRIRTMTTPRPSHAGLRALVPLGIALAAGVGATALPRPVLARGAAQPPAKRANVNAVDAAVVDSVDRGQLGQPPKVLYVLDGQELGDGTKSDSVIARLDPDRIAAVNVLKGETAVRKYGDRGRRGVVEITTKAAPAKP